MFLCVKNIRDYMEIEGKSYQAKSNGLIICGEMEGFEAQPYLKSLGYGYWLLFIGQRRVEIRFPNQEIFSIRLSQFTDAISEGAYHEIDVDEFADLPNKE